MHSRVIQTADCATACLIQSELAEAGFHPAPVLDSPHIGFAGDEHIYYVEVPDAERGAAIEFLGDHGRGQHVIDE